MPEYIPSAPIEALPPDVPQEKLPIAEGSTWTDAEALQITMSNFRLMETYRQSNVEPRWMASDRTYLAWTGNTKTWDGTRIPRANMQVYLAYQQIEVLMPQAIDAMFGGDLDFDVQPGTPETTLTQALAVRNLLINQFQQLNAGAPNFITLREIYRRMEKSSLIYGNGICEFGWENTTKTSVRHERLHVPEMAPQPINGQMVPMPTGGMTQVLNSQPVTTPISKPFLQYRSIKDFYIDPNCPSPNIQEARDCATRTLIPIADLQQFRGRPGFNIPADATLFELSKQKAVTSGDVSKSQTDAYLGSQVQPTLDQNVDPRQARVELIRYWQRGHHTWVLGRKVLALNRDNAYGVLPFLGVNYTDVPDRFYALSICDLTEGDQNLAITLLNARLDELNLIIHPPFISKRGSLLATSAAKFRPGGRFELDNPKEDLIRMEMGNVTAEAFTEVDQVERRTAKTVGVTDSVGFGVSSAGGNSALRSATGVQSQSNAQSSRVHYLVANAEDQFMLPLLTIFWDLDKANLDPNTLMQILGPQGMQVNVQGQPVTVDPVDLLNSDARFQMKTASKMKARAALQSGGLTQLLQYLGNPALLDAILQQQGLVLDALTISQLICDTYNLRSTEFFRPQTPAEQQAKQAQIMAPLQAKQQLQDSRLQAMSDDSHDKDETNLIISVIQAMAQTGALNELLGIERDTEISARKKLESGS
jgi:hypothetical protein